MDDVYYVRKATYDFLVKQTFPTPILELSPMRVDEMPYKEFFVDLSYLSDYSEINSETSFYEFSKESLYGAIVAVNVLEHCTTPWKFGEHCARLLKPEGSVFLLTPYNIRFHGPAPHLWNFTDTGLDHLMKGFRQVEIEYYGQHNKPYAIGVIYQNQK